MIAVQTGKNPLMKPCEFTVGGLFLSLFSTSILNIVALVNSQHGVMDNRCKAPSIPSYYSAEHDLLANHGGGKIQLPIQSLPFTDVTETSHWVKKKSVFIAPQICLLLQDRGSVNIYLIGTSQD